jgi:hypothetical protein
MDFSIAPYSGIVRDQLAAEAKAMSEQGEDVKVYYKKHWSTVFITGEVVDALQVGQGDKVQAFISFPCKEWNIAFSYGLSECCEGDQSEFTPEWKPSRLETDLNVAFSLDPQRKMAVERIVAYPLNVRPSYKPEDVETLGVTDKMVIAALTGGLDPMCKRPVEYSDPLAITIPPELTIGPKTFYHAAMDLIRNVGYVEHCLGSANRRGRDLGPLSGFGSGGGSFLRDFPSIQCEVQEGILWDQDTKKEGRFGLIFTTERAAVMAITLNAGVIDGDTNLIGREYTLPIRFEVCGLEIAWGKDASVG